MDNANVVIERLLDALAWVLPGLLLLLVVILAFSYADRQRGRNRNNEEHIEQ